MLSSHLLNDITALKHRNSLLIGQNLGQRLKTGRTCTITNRVFFKNIYFMCVPECMYIAMCKQKPVEVRKEHKILWNWNHIKL